MDGNRRRTTERTRLHSARRPLLGLVHVRDKLLDLDLVVAVCALRSHIRVDVRGDELEAGGAAAEGGA